MKRALISKHKKYFVYQTGWPLLAVAICLFAAVGSLLLLHSHASTSTLSFETEQGSLSGAETTIDDADASNGQAVQFGDIAPALPTNVPAGYSRAFTEDFTTPAALGSFNPIYGSRFKGYDGAKTTNKITLYDSSKVTSVSHGSMFYSMHTEGTADSYNSYAAAEGPATPSGNFLNFTYGQYGMALKLHSYSGSGFKIAFLLWPKTNQWTNEVDFPEVDPDFNAQVRAVSLSDPTQRNGSHGFAGNLQSGTHLTDQRYHYFFLDWQRPIAVSVAAANDTVTFNSPPTTSYSVGDSIEFTDVADASPLATDTTYYVQSITNDDRTMTLATTKGGPAIAFSSDGTAQAAMPMTAYMDGVKVYQWRREASIPHQPMHLVLQSEGWLKKDASNNYLPPPFGANASLEVPWVYVNTQN